MYNYFISTFNLEARKLCGVVVSEMISAKIGAPAPQSAEVVEDDIKSILADLPDLGTKLPNILHPFWAKMKPEVVSRKKDNTDCFSEADMASK